MRLPDERLLPGGAFALDELRCDTFELHTRLHVRISQYFRVRVRVTLTPTPSNLNVTIRT